MNDLKPYTKYKPSNIAWLGDIPEHWEKWKISRGVKNIGSGTTPSSGNKDFYENGTINWLNTGDFNDGILFKCKKKVTQKAIQENSALKLFPKGTLSVAMYGATIGKVCIIQFDATTNQACCNIVEGDVFCNKFLMYWFIGHKPHIVNLSYGGGQPNISQDVIKSLYVPCPNKTEQLAIANFLDYKLSKIDRFIQKKKQLIKLLNEQKAGIINDAVTKGLNPNAKMKPSGIEWLGDIPEHWEVRKLKYVVSKIGDVDHYMPPTIENGIPYVMTGNLEDFVSNIDFQSCKKVSQLDYDNLSKKIKSAKGDVILARYATIGTVTYIDIDLEFLVSYSCVTIKPNPSNLLGLYLFYYFKTNVFTLEIRNQVNVNTQGNVGIRDLKEVRIILPPYHEQINLVEFIEKETAKLNQAITTIEKEIALTQEYRVTLIAEAVTGKIDVRAYEIPETPIVDLYEELEDEMSLAAEEEVGYSTEN